MNFHYFVFSLLNCFLVSQAGPQMYVILSFTTTILQEKKQKNKNFICFELNNSVHIKSNFWLSIQTMKTHLKMQKWHF